MATSVTFNFTDAQITRIQAATDSYNARNGMALSAKEYVMYLLRAGIQSEIINSNAAQAAQTLAAAVATDLAPTA